MAKNVNDPTDMTNMFKNVDKLPEIDTASMYINKPDKKGVSKSNMKKLIDFYFYKHKYGVYECAGSGPKYFIRYFYTDSRVVPDTFGIEKQSPEAAAELIWYHMQFAKVRMGFNDTITGDRSKDLSRFITQFKILAGVYDEKDPKTLEYEEIVKIDEVIASLVVEMERATDKPYADIDIETIKNIKERFDRVYWYANQIKEKQYMRDLNEAMDIVQSSYNSVCGKNYI